MKLILQLLGCVLFLRCSAAKASSLANASRQFRAAGIAVRRLAIDGGTARSIVFSDDGGWALECRWAGAPRVWRFGAPSTASGKGQQLSRWQHQTLLEGHGGMILSAQFIRDSAAVLTGSADGTARLWDPVLGTTLHRFELESAAGWITSVAWSAGSHLIATGSNDGSARVWRAPPLQCSVDDVAVTRPRLELGGSEKAHGKSPVLCVAFGLDSQVLTASSDGSVRIWDASTAALLHTLQGHNGWVTALTVSGGIVVSGSQDNTARLWNASTGRLMQRFDHSADVVSVAFHDGLVVTACKDLKVKIWDATSGAPLRSVGGHRGTLSAVAFGKADDGSSVLLTGAIGKAPSKPPKGAELRAQCEQDCAAHDPSSGEEMPVFEI